MMLMRSPSSSSVSSGSTSRTSASMPECRSETTFTATGSPYPEGRHPSGGHSVPAQPARGEPELVPHLDADGQPPAPGPRAVLFDYGHTLVDFQRLPHALVAAYEDIRARLEHLVEHDLPQAEDLAQQGTGPADILLTHTYLQGRLEELDVVELLAK